MDKKGFREHLLQQDSTWVDLVARSELELLRKYAIEADEWKKNKRKFNKKRALFAYRHAEKNAWIYKTLSELKRLSLFKRCNTLVMVGCGMYPYSMFDIHKKHKHIKQIGIEINRERALIAQNLVENGPARDLISIINLDGSDYDYSNLEDDDLVFISCDVKADEVIKSIVEKSKAHFFICAPYKKSWIKNILYDLGITMDEHGNVIVC